MFVKKVDADMKAITHETMQMPSRAKRRAPTLRRVAAH
jgi:hypothetical protein